MNKQEERLKKLEDHAEAVRGITVLIIGVILLGLFGWGLASIQQYISKTNRLENYRQCIIQDTDKTPGVREYCNDLYFNGEK